ncbi:MAG: hypothetical protein A2992_02400 [Elusimicrobia bacterium RIFCSPLOWO2_01_FULL_59_12]|nr:MAG: hypothetical protein A2992_02400 [Elusimicrobia bacterium RIFCSPLOWO2_01_FULL_59_12]
MNPIKTIRNVLLALSLMSALSYRTLHAEQGVLNSETGVIQVFVEDETSASVPSALVYIYEGDRIAAILESDSLGSVSVSLQEGNYRFSSAVTQPFAGGIDRLASSEAYVRVSPQDRTSVVLVLRPVDDPIPALSASTLDKIGVDPDLAKYLN